MGKQLAFDLGLRPALDREDFLVAESNLAAVALVDQWPNWPSNVVAVVGPKGSGKTHLSQVWCKRSGAQVVQSSVLTIESIPENISSGALVLENVQFESISATALFHLFNLARQNSAYVLLTSSNWDTSSIKLPDLITRLSAVPLARIVDPDDHLLRGVLVKLFADRQIAVDDALVSFLLSRMPRSLDTARQLVARIDMAALEQGAEVTRHFAGRILSEMENPPLL